MTEPEAKDLLAERREKLERLRAAGADRHETQAGADD